MTHAPCICRNDRDPACRSDVHVAVGGASSERARIVAFLRDSARQFMAEDADRDLLPLDVAEAEIAALYIEKGAHDVE